MANMQNPSGGGGLFSRYTTEQVSPIPPGYLESAQAQANMYANIGSTLASMIMKKSEFDLKKQEIEAEKLSAVQKGRANDLVEARLDSGDKKLELDAWKTARELELREASEKFSRYSSADTMLQDRLDNLNRKLGKAATQKEKDDIVAEMNDISEQKGVIARGIARYIKTGTFETDAAPATKQPPNVQTKRAKLVEEYQKPGWGPRGTLADWITRGFQAKPEEKKANPNTAPSATSGAEGGGESYQEAPLDEEQSSSPETKPPVSVDGKPATIVADKPDTFIGHFDTEIKRSGPIQNSKGGSIVGEFDYAPNANRAIPGVISIKANEDLISPENKQLTLEQLEKNQRAFRSMHVLKFILENGFDYGVIPTKQQQIAANEAFNADKSPIIGRLQAAYALFDRDQNTDNPVNDEANLRFNSAFKQRFGMSVDRFMDTGSLPSAPVATRSESTLPKLLRERDSILTQLSEVNIPNLPETYQRDPYEQKRNTLVNKIAELEKYLQDNTPRLGGPVYKQITDEIDRARYEHETLIKQSDAWRKSKEDWIAQSKYDSERLKEKSSAISKNIESVIAGEKYLSEQADEFGKKSATWLGARPEDTKLLNGWLARAIIKFPRVVVNNEKGRPISLNPGEYLDWVNETENYAHFRKVNAMVRAPSEEDQKEAIQANADHLKLIGPLNELVSQWMKTGKENVPDALFKKFLDPNTAAQENNVFQIMAARRKPVTGGGNPSNFEQQMLLSGIPNPGSVFTLSDLNIFRLRTIAVLSMLEHARSMQNHGYAITQDAIDSYNVQYQGILGRRITMSDFNKYQRFVNDRKGAYEGNIGRITTEDARAMGNAAVLEFDSLIQKEFPKK